MSQYHKNKAAMMLLLAKQFLYDDVTKFENFEKYYDDKNVGTSIPIDIYSQVYLICIIVFFNSIKYHRFIHFIS